MSRFYFITLLVVLTMVTNIQLVFSQPGNPGGDTVPITGIEWLLGAGALWGLKKYHDIRKKK